MTKRERTRATVGDRIAAKASAEFGYPGDVPIEDLARRIDTAIKRAVREGFGWGRNYELCKQQGDTKQMAQSREHINTTYGTRIK